jgi:hypothetical protein
MKLTKYFISILLVFCMVSSLVPMGVMADEAKTIKNITISKGETKEISFSDTNYEVPSDVDTNIAAITKLSGESGETVNSYAKAYTYNDSTYTGEPISIDSCLYSFAMQTDGTFEITAPNTNANGTWTNVRFNTKWGSGNTGDSSQTLNYVKFSNSTNPDGFYIYSTSGSYYSKFNSNAKYTYSAKVFSTVSDTAGNEDDCTFYLYRQATDGEISSTEIPNYVKITSLNDIKDNGQYLIVAVSDDTYYAVRPSDSGTPNDQIVRIETVNETEFYGNSSFEITGVAVGTTTATFGNTVYNINVVDTKSLTVNVGESITVIEDSGSYTTADLDDYDKSIVGVSIESAAENKTDITFTGVSTGITKLKVGNNVVYDISVTVSAPLYEKYITLHEGETKTLSFTDGNYPLNTDDTDESIATITKDSSSSTIYAIANTATDINFSGDTISLKECLYDFTLTSDNQFNVTAPVGNDTAVLDAYWGSSNSKTSNPISFESNGNDGFYLYGHHGGYYFKFNDSEKHFANSSSVTSTDGIESDCTFYLYRPANEFETSSKELKNFVKLTGVDEIEDGGQYLIVRKIDDEYYIARPSLSSNKYEQLVKVNGEYVFDYTSDFTVTGNSAGNTTAVIGNTLYNITVVDYYEKDIVLYKGAKTSVDLGTSALGSNTSEIDTGVATVSLSSDGKTATFAGVSSGTTSVMLGDTKYNITVYETPFVAGTGKGLESTYSSGRLTKLTTSVGLEYQINIIDDFSYTNISWSVEDESIATIDENGKLTALAIGQTYAKAVIDGVEYKMPVVVINDFSDKDVRTYDVFIDEITNTTVYYSLDCSTEMVKIEQGEAIYINADKANASCLDVFAAADEGYALTYMAAANDQNAQFFAIDGDTATDTEFYTATYGAGFWQKKYFTDDVVAEMVQAAMDLDCDGAAGMTRGVNDTSNFAEMCYIFRSQKLPTVEKTISKIVRSIDGVDTILETNTGDITVVEGDVIYYTITVTQYETTEELNFANAVLTDNMSVSNSGDNTVTRDAYFVGTDSNNKSIDLLSGTLDDDITYTYENAVSYTVQADDIGRELINNISLAYNYGSQYRQSGVANNQSNTASFARISAFAFEPDDIVIDFGLPVTVDFNEQLEKYSVDLDNEKFNTKYGSVEITNNKVTYTPTTVLLDSDTIKLTNSIGGTASFKVYPASSVYYEEGFAQYTGSWTETGSKGANPQTTSSINSTANYGYDDSYAAENLGFSNSTSALSKTYGDTATFTFTGTGIEIYGSSIKNQDDLVSVQIRRKSDNKLIKLYAINTALRNGKTTVTDYDDIDKAYSMLLVSNLNLDYDTYTIKIYHSRLNNITNTFEFDGFRVYGTLEQERGNNIYSAAGEDNAIYAELRDNVLGALSVKTDEDNTAYSKQIENGLSQVYNTSDNTVGAVVVNASDKTDHSYSQDNAQDLLDNGPKNELYLYSGQSVVFTIKDTGYKNIQVGMKAVSANASYEIKCGDSIVSNGNITSCTDMYYPVATNVSGDTTVTITNTGDGILSLTKIKLAGLSTATASQTSRKVSFARLSAKSFMPALKSLNYISQTLLGDVNSDGTLDVSDATEIQKYLAGYELDNFDKAAADVDSSGNIDIKDATCIQKQLAGLA